MTTVRTKAEYVKSQRQTRNHTCHWPDCDRQVPPAMWGCRSHWFELPVAIRKRIWSAYEPGQEKTMSPSPEYLDAAQAAQDWIAGQVQKGASDDV